MKKKAVIFLTLIFFCGTFVVSGYAAEATGEDGELSLTFEDAYNMALENSKEIKKLVANKEKSLIIKDEMSENVTFVPYSHNNPAAVNVYKTAAQAEIAYQVAGKQIELEKEKLFYSVKEAYNSVLTELNNMRLAEEKLEVAKSDLNIAKIKVKHGLASKLEQTIAEKSLVEAQENVKAQIATLHESYRKLNDLLGLDPEARPVLTEIPEYEVLDMDEKGLDVHVSRITSSSSTPIWLQEKNIDLAELDLNLFAFNDPTVLPYDAREIDVSTSKTTLAQTKDTIESAARSIYNNIKMIESKLENLRATLAKAQENAKVTNMRYELGLATKYDVQKAELNVTELENAIYGLEIQHDTLRSALNVPWAMSR